jgi:Protein of unknown function (DUF2975)
MFVLVIELFIVAVALGLAARSLWRGRRTVTEPLAGVTWLYGAFLFLYLVGSVITIDRGFAGTGPHGLACADTGYTTPAQPGQSHVGHGATLWTTGQVNACVTHPSAVQWLLLVLVHAPGLVVWTGVVLMIWRVLHAAEQAGPFTPPAASAIRQLGWFVIIAPVVAGMLGHLGADLLTRMVMTPPTFDHQGVVLDVLLVAPLKALFPVPALAGAGLLTFARISKVGVAMDEEIKATV